MEIPEYAGDPLHQAFLLVVSRQEHRASMARSAERRGDTERARALRASVEDVDETLAMLKRLLRRNPKVTREAFSHMLALAKQNGHDGGFASVLALYMVVDIGQTLEAYDQNAELAGWIESSRVAPEMLPPEEELRLWNERAQAAYANEVAKRSNSEFDADTHPAPLNQDRSETANDAPAPSLQNGTPRPGAPATCEGPSGSDGGPSECPEGTERPDSMGAESLTEKQRAAADDLRYKLAVANDALRKKYTRGGVLQKRTVTQGELAATMNLRRTYLNQRARQLKIDLKPYTLLYGPPLLDPLMVVERT